MRTTDTNYGRDYFETLDNGDGYRDSTMWEDIAHAIKETFGIDREAYKDISGSVNVLDIGCAKGYLVKHLRRRGFDAWGVDISDYALENGDPEVKTFLRKFDLTKQEDTHFGREQFRLAVCLETMEHIPEEHVAQALKHIYNVLKPGGLALFAICTDKQPGWDSDPTHVTIKDRLWWGDQLLRAGLMPHQSPEWKRIMGYWLFQNHDGIFVVRRPS